MNRLTKIRRGNQLRFGYGFCRLDAQNECSYALTHKVVNGEEQVGGDTVAEFLA